MSNDSSRNNDASPMDCSDERVLQSFLSFYDFLPEIAFMADGKGQLLHLIRAWSRYTGQPLESMKEAWLESIHPDDRARVLAVTKSLSERSDSCEVEYRLRRADGAYFYHLTRFKPQNGPDGQPIRWFGTTTNIDAQRRAEEHARKSERQLELILETMADSIVMVDANGVIAYANSSALKGAGTTRENFVGKNFYDITTAINVCDEFENPLPISALPVFQVLAGKRTPSELVFGYRLSTKSETRWLCAEARGVYGENGELTMVIAVSRDYSKEKRTRDTQSFSAEAASLLGSSIDYATTIKQVTTLSVKKIADWCSVYVMAGDQIELLSVAHRDPAKLALIERISQANMPRLTDDYGAGLVIRTGQIAHHPVINKASLDVSPARDADNEAARMLGMNSYLCVPLRVQGKVMGALQFINTDTQRAFSLDDVTLVETLAARAGIAIENARLYSHAQNVNRIKDEFLATLSHELRTPLTVIQGHAELLRQRCSGQPSLIDPLDAIDRNAKVQTQIINDLLDISAIVTGKIAFQPVALDPSRVAKAAVESVTFTARMKKIEIQADLEPAPNAVFGDPTRLQQIVWNLLSNAVKFTPSRGRISVRGAIEAGWYQLEVTDDGMGIAPEFLPFIFDRFSQEDATTTRRFGGLGLGLSIARQLAELHGGSITVSSAGKGKGSGFRVRLPLAVDFAALPANQPPESTRPPEEAQPTVLANLPRHARVLLVEDQDDARELLTEALIDAGADVCACPDAEEALRVIRDYGPNLIISDISMPGKDGLTLIREIRELKITAPAVALTAYARQADRAICLAAGYQEHVAKPVAISHLLERLVFWLPPKK